MAVAKRHPERVEERMTAKWGMEATLNRVTEDLTMVVMEYIVGMLSNKLAQ